ncbi:MAG: hypothetical protein L6R42_006143, partial [Xanthoria sp. 1 TBL-2021]
RLIHSPLLFVLPLGGIAPVASGIQSSILASSQLQIRTTVSFAPSVTGVDQASSILATATPAPNLGNPAGNVYPDCTLTCVNETAGLITEPNNLYQICGVLYRTQTAVCEAALCSDSDRQSTYEIYYELMLGGRFAQQIENLHERYGPIVRINPFEFHINDLEYYNQIYNFDHNLEKRDYHIQNVQHTGPHPDHRPLRRVLDPYLSRTTIQHLEPLIKHNIEALCRHIAAKSHQQPIKLSHLYRCMTADIITSYTLGKSYNLLAVDNEGKSESFLRAFRFTFRLLWLLREIPYLGVVVRLVGKGVGRWCGGSGIIPTLLRWQWEIDTHLSFLRTSPSSPLAPPSSTPTNPTPSIIPSYIHNPSLPSSFRSGQPLHDTTVMLLAAGFETTGFTLTTTTYHLLSPSSTSHLQTLLSELHTAIPDPTSIPSWSTLQKLPYLTAIIQESLRLSLGASARLPRRNSKEDMWYKGWKIPRGTVVGMTHADLHYDPILFPDPKRFDPGRWLGDGEDVEVVKRRESLAHAELFLTLPTIFRRYGEHMALWETERKDVEPARDFFVPAPEPGGNGLRVTVK